MSKPHQQQRLLTINRTILELKLFTKHGKITKPDSINRTILELKLNEMELCHKSQFSINRTILELKH